jgi:prephenate dehydrogenase
MFSTEPPFRSIGIVGLGLIGGSVALAARQRWPGCRITAVDKASVTLEGKNRGAIDAGGPDLSFIDDAELIVLAVPVSDNVSYLAEMGALVSHDAVVTDVGGTKRSIVDAAATLPRHITFVGGHPLAGSERAGLASARADLFVDRPWVFTPVEGEADAPASTAAIERLSRFVSGLGALPSAMSADAHDRLMALVSHLPQLTATALMDVVGRAVGPDGLSLAGQGLIDTTRLASSPASVWKDVCASNADALGPALDLLIVRLRDVRSGLDRGTAIDSLFEDAGNWRAALMKDRAP